MAHIEKIIVTLKFQDKEYEEIFQDFTQAHQFLEDIEETELKSIKVEI